MAILFNISTNFILLRLSAFKKLLYYDLFNSGTTGTSPVAPKIYIYYPSSHISFIIFKEGKKIILTKLHFFIITKTKALYVILGDEISLIYILKINRGDYAGIFLFK